MAFTHVQDGTVGAGSLGTMSLTLPAASGQGSLLIATVSSNQGTSVFTSPGGGWTHALSVSAGTGLRAELWYWAYNPGGISAVTWSNGTTGIPKGGMSEFATPAGTTQKIGPTGTGSGTAGTAFSATAGSANQPGVLGIFHAAAAYSTAPAGASWTAPSGWTLGRSVNNSVQVWWGGYQLSLAAGTTTASASESTSVNLTFWTALLATFSQQPLEMAGATDRLAVSATLAVPDAAGAADAITHSVVTTKTPADAAGAADALAVPTRTNTASDRAGAADALTVTKTFRFTEAAGAADALAVQSIDVVSFTPAALAPTGPGVIALEETAGVPFVPPAVPAFIASTMPRLHLQDLLTGTWLARDVQNTSSPLITRQLNAAGTFAVTLGPPDPRSGLLDATGNPAVSVWRTAAYLEQDGQIGWGGICTAASPAGQQLALTFTEFSGYANGMPYEGPAVSQPGIDALDAVRLLWAWLQSQPDSNLGLELAPDKAGVLLGTVPQYNASSVLSAPASPGDKRVGIVNVSAHTPGQPASSVFTVGAQVQVGSDPPHKITTAGTDHLILDTAIKISQPAGALVGQVTPAAPFTLNWFDATDIGQEIQQIQAEAVFDIAETHAWADAGHRAVRHRLGFGIPRIGTRRADLRFAEGENIIQPGQGSQDGSRYANSVIVTGAGSGSAMVTSSAAVVDGRLRRVLVYTDQTITRPDRAASRAVKVLESVRQLDTISQIVVRDHDNARFGSFGVGDDILVRLASGWRNAGIWSRITGITQDPTTNLITVGLARSDSFTYTVPTSTGGTL